MKKILVVAVAGVIVIAMAMSVNAAPPVSITAGAVGMTGNVIGKCKVDALNSASILAFGDLDPEAGTAQNSPASATGTIKMFCTNGYSTYAISAASTNGATGDCSAGPITGKLLNGLGNLIDYSFTCLKPAGTGFSAAVDIAPAATINMAAFPDAAMGAYTDTVTLTVTY